MSSKKSHSYCMLLWLGVQYAYSRALSSRRSVSNLFLKSSVSSSRSIINLQSISTQHYSITFLYHTILLGIERYHKFVHTGGTFESLKVVSCRK